MTPATTTPATTTRASAARTLLRSAAYNRRRLLQHAATAALGSALLPLPAVWSDDKSGVRLPIIGVEGHRFEVRHNCMQLPASVRWQETHGVAVDAEGLVYVKHRTKTKDRQDAIVVFDEQGRFVRSFGKLYHSGGHGIDIRRDGGEEFLYLSDLKGYVAKTTLRGELVWRKSAPPLDVYARATAIPDGEMGRASVFTPTNVAFAPDGGFYVADGYGSHYILQYDRDGELVRHWGGEGKEPGKMRTPHGLWWDARPGREPALVVADRANARLQYFSASGEHLSFVEGLLFPADIDIRGDVMLVPDLHARLTLFDRDNQVISHLGDDPEWRAAVLADNFAMRSTPERWVNGKFVHPHDACFDHQGNIYVAEWVSIGRVTRLRHVG